MISANRALIGGGGTDGAIQEAAEPGLLDECQKLNGCETGKCKVTLGYTLPAKYMFHTVRPSDKNDYKLNDCYKSCLQSLLHFSVEQMVFLCLIQGKLLNNTSHYQIVVRIKSVFRLPSHFLYL